MVDTAECTLVYKPAIEPLGCIHTQVMNHGIFFDNNNLPMMLADQFHQDIGSQLPDPGQVSGINKEMDSHLKKRAVSVTDKFFSP
jgi:hypothetical protein